MHRKRVLIIDDEREFCHLAKMNLELVGNFKVFMATDGRAGFKMAREEKPDVIILDIRMPGMDGFETLKKLKDDFTTVNIPVVMLSALGDDDSKAKAAELYNEEYITKPIDTTQLKNKIEAILKRKGAVS